MTILVLAALLTVQFVVLQAQTLAPGQTLADGAYPEQQRRVAGTRKESYLRLRMLVDGRQMSVVDVKEVDGPLVQAETLLGNFVYEVEHAGKRLAVEHVPDLAVRRSDPRIDGPAEGRVHHLEPLFRFEFNVRVSTSVLTKAALPETEIALYEVTADTPPQPISGQLLSAQFSQHLREVARLRGIHIESLTESAKAALQGALR